MEVLNFREELEKFSNQTGDHKHMALATCDDNYPTVRTMSVIIYNDNIYFQTGTDLHKYDQISANKNVALCFDNVQIEGIAKIIGKPLDKNNEEIMEKYKKCFESSFKKYSYLDNEVLIMVKIKKITIWKYDAEQKPYRVFIDVDKENAYMEYYFVVQ